MSPWLPRLCLGVSAAVLASCGVSAGGGSPSGQFAGAEGAVTAATATYALVDLQTNGLTWRADLPDLAGNASYRDRTLVFHRVGSGAAMRFIGVFELTQAQWQRIAGTQPWLSVPGSVVDTDAQAGARPAYNIEYDDAVAKLAAFAVAGGASMRLPSDGEWQLAAGVNTGWTWGASSSRAQVAAAAVLRETSAGFAGPLDVGGRSPNANGFFDLHGNVWEWTSPGATVRGGSWHDTVGSSRVDVAPTMTGTVEHALVGLRLVLQP